MHSNSGLWVEAAFLVFTFFVMFRRLRPKLDTPRGKASRQVENGAERLSASSNSASCVISSRHLLLLQFREDRMGGEFHPLHWFVVLTLFSYVIPIGAILKRTGHSPAWCLLCLFPPVAFALLWIFAFKPWPIDHQPVS